MSKILITGSPESGLSGELRKYLPPENVDWASRTNGWDLSGDLTQFFLKSLDYDAVINNSRLKHFQQTKILLGIAEVWDYQKKRGRIINIGSTADRGIPQVVTYSTEKSSLRKASSMIHFRYCFRKSFVASTYIALGYLDTPTCQAYHDKSIKKMELKKAAEIIVFSLNQPDGINIEEIRMEPVQ